MLLSRAVVKNYVTINGWTVPSIQPVSHLTGDRIFTKRCQAKEWYCYSGAKSACMAVLDDFMAADETFNSARALQEATAKDVEQRIATAHLRPMPSHVAPSRPQAIRPTTGEIQHTYVCNGTTSGSVLCNVPCLLIHQMMPSLSCILGAFAACIVSGPCSMNLFM